jgi:DNA-binding transcriptional regulator YiaG
MPPKTEKLLKELKAWCDQEYGRRAEVARAVGTTRGAVTHWFAGRQQPTAEQALELLEFLKKQGRHASKK